jgi:hypothetical protein
MININIPRIIVASFRYEPDILIIQMRHVAASCSLSKHLVCAYKFYEVSPIAKVTEIS